MAETQDALSQPERIIRNAVIHLANEQPLLADLIGMPEASQVTLVCTNLRTLGGKRPVFADHSESTFFFPMAHIRFVEVPPAGAGMPGSPDRPAAVEPVAAGVGAGESDLEIDEEFLRRIREA
jgi:hypothetical protein